MIMNNSNKPALSPQMQKEVEKVNETAARAYNMNNRALNLYEAAEQAFQREVPDAKLNDFLSPEAQTFFILVIDWKIIRRDEKHSRALFTTLERLNKSFDDLVAASYQEVVMSVDFTLALTKLS